MGGLQKVWQKKNNRRVDCAEADKKTVQAQRNEGRGFLAAGDCPEELPVINLQAKPDRINNEMNLQKKCENFKNLEQLE